MGGVGTERSFSGDEIVESAGGAGHGLGGLVEFRYPAGRHGDGEVTVTELHGGVAEPAHGPGETAGDDVADGGADGDHPGGENAQESDDPPRAGVTGGGRLFGADDADELLVGRDGHGDDALAAR